MPSDDGGRPALVWRSLPVRLALVAIPLWFTVAVLIFAVPLSIKLVVGGVLATSLVSPAAGLIAVAVLAPLGQLLAHFVGVEAFRMSEAVVLAFVTGWLLRAPRDRHGPGVPPAIGWLLAATAVASVVGLARQLGHIPGALPVTFDLIYHEYFLFIDALGFSAAARFVEGVVLAVATITLFRQRPRLAVTLPMALTASAMVAAASSLLLWWGIAPAAVLARYARIGYRVSAHVADLNAAGSYFAMTLCLALGMAARAHRRPRAFWSMAALITAVGLWFAESRSALAAAGLAAGFGIAWRVTSAWRPSRRAIALASVVVAVFVVGGARAYLAERDPTYRGAGFRTEFNATSLRMIAAQPLFGVGVGQYYRTSPLFLSPQLAWSYGAENAHNYFLQVGAELGVAGLALFAAWVGAVLWLAIKALGAQPDDSRLLGATIGVVAMLGTCLTGHPLLVDEVEFPFWIQFGLVAALAGSVQWNAKPAPVRLTTSTRTARVWPVAASAAAACLLLSGPLLAARRHVEPPASQSVDGFYGWETDTDGRRFRWTGAYASLFVPADVTHVYIPVRVPTDRPAVAPIGVEVSIGGVSQSRTWVDNSWSFLAVRLPDARLGEQFKRIDLKVDRTWQPALYVAGSANMNPVGVQVGECELVR